MESKIKRDASNASHRKRNRLRIRVQDKAYRDRSEVPATRKRARRLQEHGMEVEDFLRLYAEQGGHCAICGGEDADRSLSVDHCHVTGKRRGLLCRNCNLALGLLRDDPERLKAALAYLERA